jgi:hypothetical protein
LSSKPKPPSKEDVLQEAKEWAEALGAKFETRSMKKERLLNEWRDAWTKCGSAPTISCFADAIGMPRNTVKEYFDALVKDGDMIYVERTYVPRP